MMYELFGFELADFRELFYVFCLGVLVYRYCTVGHKYPLFSCRKKEPDTAERVETGNPVKRIMIMSFLATDNQISMTPVQLNIIFLNKKLMKDITTKKPAL